MFSPVRLCLLPLALLAICLTGCFPRVYEAVPQALGLPRAERTVTEAQVTLEKDGHVFVFNRGKRPATVNGVLYYLHQPAGINELNALDAELLRQAVVMPGPRKTTLAVMLDPGHGGTDTGCRVGKTHEKSITLAIALEVKRLLEVKGHRVFLTRTDDRTTRALDERTALAAVQPLDAFVSIHVNSAANPEAKGVEVYTLPAPGCDGTNADAKAWPVPLVGQAHLPEATRLAFGVQRALLAQSLPPVDRGVKHAHYKVLRDTPAPSVLVEVGFLTNGEDFVRLTRPDGQQAFAAAIAKGIEDALTR